MSELLITDLGEVILTEDKILRIRLLIDDEITLEKTRQHYFKVHDYLGENLRCGVLLDTRDVNLYRIKPEVMSYQADNEFSKYPLGMAVLVNSRVVKQLFTMFNMVYRPTVVTRVFTDEELAKEWLRSLV